MDIFNGYIEINNSRQNIMTMRTNPENPVLLISGEEDMVCPTPQPGVGALNSMRREKSLSKLKKLLTW